MVNFIWITTQKEMYHQYLNAPDDVAFLRNKHRHLFHFRVYIQVEHDDRSIEFFQFQRFVNSILDDIEENIEHKSCEMISNFLAMRIMDKYPNRDVQIEVSEDGENGSLYYYPKGIKSILNKINH